MFTTNDARNGKSAVLVSECSAKWLLQKYPSYHRNAKLGSDGKVYMLTTNGIDAKYVSIDDARLVVDVMANKRSTGGQATIAAKKCAKRKL